MRGRPCDQGIARAVGPLSPQGTKALKLDRRGKLLTNHESDPKAYFIRLPQVWKDLQVSKALWELWEPWGNRVTQEQPGQQGPRALRDLRDLLQLNLRHMQPPLVHQDRQVRSMTLQLEQQNKTKA